MLQMTRHGDPDHFVRPDRITRTGVIQSMQNYDPDQDVQSVAAAFTNYPMSLQTPAPLSGLGRALAASTNLNFMQRALYKFRAWKANRNGAGAFIATGNAASQSMQGLGSAFMQAADVSPEMSSKLSSLVAMMVASAPNDIQAQAIANTMERWNNLRWNG